MTIDELKVEIRAETEQLKKDIANVKRQFKDVNKSANDMKAGVGRSFKKMASTMALAFAGLKIGKYIKDSIKTAMDAIESESLFETVMGKWSKSVRAWSMELQSQLGLNGYEIRKNVGVLYNMTSSMGIAEDKALKMSKSLTMLAYDMASFRNMSTEEAFNKIRAGITGETEPLKRLGILVDENTIKQVAYRRGIASVGQELTQQQKVMARYMAIMEQTSNDQGDLARTIKSPANQLRILNTQLEIVRVNIGRAFMPIVNVVLPLLNDFAIHLSIITDQLANFMELITGSSASDNNSFDKVKNDIEATGKEAIKAGKAVKGMTAGFDELNILNAKSGGSGGSVAAAKQEKKKDEKSKFKDEIDNVKKQIEVLKNQLSEKYTIGFNLGIGNKEEFDEKLEKITQNKKNIQISIQSIIENEGVNEEFVTMLDKIAETSGKIAGSFERINNSVELFFSGSISKFLGDNESGISKEFEKLFKNVGDIAEQLGISAEILADFFELLETNTAISIFAGVIKTVLLTPLTLLNFKLGIVSFAFEVFNEVASAFLDWVLGVPEALASVGEAFKSLGEWFKETAYYLVQNLKDSKREVGELISKVIQWLSEVWEKGDETWEGMTKKFNEFKDGISKSLSNWISSIKGVFAKGWTAAVNIAVAVFNGFTTKITNGINGAIGGINDLLKSYNSVAEKIKAPTVSLLGMATAFQIQPIQVPAYASGGYPSTGQMFIARESGPEMVGAIGNRTAVANNDQIVESISRGVYAAVASALGGMNQNQEIKISIDGEDVAFAVEKRQKEQGINLYDGGIVYG